MAAGTAGSTHAMYAFPKSLRLRHRTEFKRALDHGHKTVCREMVLFGRVRDDAEANGDVRLGLIVSKKVGNAAERNRVKRCLREGFRHLQPELSASDTFKGMDIVIIARGTHAGEDGNDTLDALRHCLARFARQRRAHERTS